MSDEREHVHKKDQEPDVEAHHEDGPDVEAHHVHKASEDPGADDGPDVEGHMVHKHVHK